MAAGEVLPSLPVRKSYSKVNTRLLLCLFQSSDFDVKFFAVENLVMSTSHRANAVIALELPSPWRLTLIPKLIAPRSTSRSPRSVMNRLVTLMEHLPRFLSRKVCLLCFVGGLPVILAFT